MSSRAQRSFNAETIFMNHILSSSTSDLYPFRHKTLGRYRGPSTMVGHTPVLWISEPFAHPDHGFWAKLEGFNPGGMKDRPAMHMVERARSRGDLQSGARIIESISGTLGLGLALAGTVYRHPVTLVAFLLPFLDLGIAQSPMLRPVPQQWADALPGYGWTKVLFDTGLTAHFDQGGPLLIGCAWLVGLLIAATLVDTHAGRSA